MKYLSALLILFTCFSCMTLPREVQDSLRLAGKNQQELIRVLKHYQKAEDSLKFKATCFLICNMRWHSSDSTKLKTDPQLEIFRHTTDSLYYGILQEKKGATDSLVQCATELRTRYPWLSDSIRNHKFSFFPSKRQSVPDLHTLSSTFLIDHIDHAFQIWKSSPLARDLTFEEFCEYLLPYRSTGFPASLYSSKTLHHLFGKYVNYEKQVSLPDCIKRYNQAIGAFRDFWGDCPAKDPIGIYNLCFHGQDCADIANYGTNILRACGVPVMVEFCYLYRNWGGRHFYCVALDSNKQWQTFNAESSLPGEGDWVYSPPMNLYRQYYGAQKDSPWFLRNKDEYLPPLFSTPCIREITGERSEVYQVCLPFDSITPNHLAYLGGFNLMESGVSPVTWGKIDPGRQAVTFDQVMPNRLYFPLYYQEEKQVYFGDPFYVEKDSIASGGFSIHRISSDSDRTTSLLLTRRGPRKHEMVELAEKLIGGTFSGANTSDFSDEKILYTIQEAPLPYFREYLIKHPAPYQYYRFKAPDAYPHANLSMLEFLTDKKYGYKNTMPPTRTAILCPEEESGQANDSRLVKLLDAPTWEETTWKSEYDGNMQTAPGGYSTINLWLKEPQVVTRIRFAPRNGDDGIHASEKYQLAYWDRGWHKSNLQSSPYEYIKFTTIPANGLYWLRNGQANDQEFLFLLKGGKQQFLYYDTLHRK